MLKIRYLIATDAQIIQLLYSSVHLWQLLSVDN